MAELTLAQIRTHIRKRGDYQNVRRFSDEYLNDEIQKGFRAFYQIVSEAHVGFWDTLGNVTTSANVAYVAPPTGTWVVLGVDRYDGTEPIPMLKVGVGDRNKFGVSTGKPVAYRLTARGLDLHPTPDAAYTLRVIYTPLAPNLGESQPREWYNGWEDYVIEWVLLKLAKMVGRPQGEHMAALEAAEKALRSGANARGAQEPEYLRLYEYDTSDPWDDGVL